LNFSIYPNPVSDVLTIEGIENVNTIQIIDAKGSIVYSKKISAENQLKVDVSSFATGTYQVVFSTNNQTSVKTFVKK
jgi:hypothetical protein